MTRDDRESVTVAQARKVEKVLLVHDTYNILYLYIVHTSTRNSILHLYLHTGMHTYSVIRI